MNIEQEIFKKSIINYSKLKDFGFQKKNNLYIYTENILNNIFKVEITIDLDNNVVGKIIDLNTLEEYINYRLDYINGEFVSKVRNEFINILQKIKDNCTKTELFISNQANRITKLIFQKYQSKPEFLWKDGTSAVFRHKENQKWYGLIMNINRQKLTKGEGNVDILNLKLKEEEIKNLLLQKGYYECYHMNKTKWLTIILDDTLSDDVIMKHVSESFDLTN